MNTDKVDIVLIEKIKEKLKEENQSDELIKNIIDLLVRRDNEKINIEKKNEAILNILKGIKL